MVGRDDRRPFGRDVLGAGDLEAVPHGGDRGEDEAGELVHPRGAALAREGVRLFVGQGHSAKILADGGARGLPRADRRSHDGPSGPRSSSTRAPGLPTREEVAAEREKLQKDKAGAGDRAGRVPRRRARRSRVRPPPDRRDAARRRRSRSTTSTAFARDGLARPRPRVRRAARERRHRRAAQPASPQRRGRHHASAPLEAGDRPRCSDDDQVEICVLRGGVVEHPRYAGRRIFGAGLNLTHLYRGQISYLFFPVRDLGLVHKVFRARQAVDRRRGDVRDRRRLPAAAVRRPHHLRARHAASRCRRATRGSSPAPRTCGCRASSATAARARRSSPAPSSQPEELADEIVEPGEMDAAIERPRRRALQRRRGQRRREPQGVPRRPGAARHLPRVHVRLLPRAGGLLLQPRADPQPRGELACPRERRLSASSSGCAGRRSGERIPQRWSSIEDLPFTVKDDLREHYPLGLVTVPRDELRRIHASSGSRGKPTVVAYTQHDLDVWSEVMAYCMTMAGVRPGMVVHNAYGYGLFTGGLGFHQGAERIGALTIPVCGGVTARQALLLRDLRRPGAVLHAVVRAAHRAGPARGGDRAGGARAADRHVRRRAVDRGDAHAARGRARPDRAQRLRPVGDRRAGRRRRVPGGPRRPARDGGPLPRRGHRPGDRRAGRPTAPTASSSSRP